MTIHVRADDGDVAVGRGQAHCHCHLCRRLCGAEGEEVTEVSDAGLHPGRPEVNLEVCG